MKKEIIYFILIMFAWIISCDKESVKPDNEDEKPTEQPEYSLLTSKSRKLVSYVVSNGTQESDMTEGYQDCDFEATYTYFTDSTYIRHDVCYNHDTEENWFFKNDSSSVYHYTDNGNDTTEYIILILNTSQLKLELIDKDITEGYHLYLTFE